MEVLVLVLISTDYALHKEKYNNETSKCGLFDSLVNVDSKVQSAVPFQDTKFSGY